MRLELDQIDELLKMQRNAYQLLIWLDERAIEDPSLLSPSNVQKLRNPSACRKWLKESRHTLPSEFLPETSKLSEYVGILSSFFDVSLHVEHVIFEGKLISSRLANGASDSEKPKFGKKRIQILALKHLASNINRRISEEEAEQLSRRDDIKQDLRLWTYVWELARRAAGKSKDAAIHTLWRGLPFPERQSLDVETIWKARERLIEILNNQ